MARKKKVTSEPQGTVLAKDIQQLSHDGLESLTKPALRRLKNAIVERLKVVDQDHEVKQRAIEENIFPIARALFPDDIINVSDVDIEGKSLTAAFKKKSEKPRSGKRQKPTSEQYDQIIDLMRAWRDNFRHVRFIGVQANGFIASGGGIEYQVADSDANYIRTSRFWPELDFRKD